MTRKLIATTALAALAFPTAAAAEKPTQKPAKPSKPAKTKSVGFTVAGVDLSGLSVTGGKLSGPLTLDPTSANKHARTFLQLTKADVAGEKTVSLGTAGDAVRVRYEGLTASDAIQPTDRVKVIGKLSGQTLDIRKITVTRGDATESDTKTSTTTVAATKAQASKTAPGQVCRKESRRKTNKGKGKSPFAACVTGVKRAEQQEQAKPAEERKNPAELCQDQSRKKAEGDTKSPYAACVSGAAKAQNEQS